MYKKVVQKSRMIKLQKLGLNDVLMLRNTDDVTLQIFILYTFENMTPMTKILLDLASEIDSSSILTYFDRSTLYLLMETHLVFADFFI